MRGDEIVGGFGGDRTEKKLERVRQYMQAYLTIMHGNERARHLRTMYVDAFAGSGVRMDRQRYKEQIALPFEDEDLELRNFRYGSARLALELEGGFDRYVLVELDQSKSASLARLRSDYPSRANQIEIACCDANARLTELCNATDWRSWRALVFLDPFGMQVDWSTIEALGDTNAVDLWYLFPLNAVSRMLPRNRPPRKEWADRLTSVLGADDWQSAFYTPSGQGSLFGTGEGDARDANSEAIISYVKERLRTAFCAVADNPLVLFNSRNSPLFLLCFACANPKGAKPAIKIAQHILGM
jgi:three-Cys-motif partner protein